MCDFSFWYFWDKVEKSHPQKRLEFRVGSNWLNFCWLRFGGCHLCIHLSQAFLHQFSNFVCPSCWKFPEFFKTSQHFKYAWFSCPRSTRMKNRPYWMVKKGQICGFAQIDIFLISNFFGFFVHNFLQNHPNVKSWVCFEKFRKFSARWAQKFLKLMKKCLR